MQKERREEKFHFIAPQRLSHQILTKAFGEKGVRRWKKVSIVRDLCCQIDKHVHLKHACPFLLTINHDDTQLYDRKRVRWNYLNSFVIWLICWLSCESFFCFWLIDSSLSSTWYDTQYCSLWNEKIFLTQIIFKVFL